MRDEGDDPVPLGMDHFQRTQPDQSEERALGRIAEEVAPKALRFKAVLEKETEGAILVRCDGNLTPMWLPKSEVIARTRSAEDGKFVILLKLWIARKKGIIGEVVKLGSDEPAEPANAPVDPVAPNVAFPEIKPRVKTHEEYRKEMEAVLAKMLGREVT